MKTARLLSGQASFRAKLMRTTQWEIRSEIPRDGTGLLLARGSVRFAQGTAAKRQQNQQFFSPRVAEVPPQSLKAERCADLPRE